MEINLDTNTKNREILSMVSHDIKSPLNGILGLAELLSLEIKDENQVKMVSLIRKAGEDILFLVNNVLSMAKIAAGEEEPDFVWIPDLDSYLREISSTFITEARAKNIQLEVFSDKSIPAVYWDMERLRLHTFNNLLSNALKFTPSGGTIRITTSKYGKDTIRIVVEDSGPGIPESRQDFIFEAFKQVMDNGVKKEGHGLGLFNARRFVLRHGGTIKLEKSNSERKFGNNLTSGELGGARFSIDLPVYPEIQENQIKKMEKQFLDAQKIQKSMLPDTLTLPGFDIAAEFIPAGQVGGDWYDVQHISERYACVSIGDISGKGLGASLSMSSVISLLRGNAYSLTNPHGAYMPDVEALPDVKEILRLTNNVLINQSFASFATALVGVIDLFKKTFTYISAGHEPGFLIRDKKVIKMQTGGGPLGIFCEKSFNQMLEKHTIELRPNDHLILYTDGVSEAYMDQGMEIENVLRALVSREMVLENSTGFLNRIMNSVPERAPGNRDDIAMMVLKVN